MISYYESKHTVRRRDDVLNAGVDRAAGGRRAAGAGARGGTLPRIKQRDGSPTARCALEGGALGGGGGGALEAGALRPPASPPAHSLSTSRHSLIGRFTIPKPKDNILSGRFFEELSIKVKRGRIVGKKKLVSFFGMTGRYATIILEDKQQLLQTGKLTIACLLFWKNCGKNNLAVGSRSLRERLTTYR
ncbi:hypothetical protein EVAR_41913_1 [Eumeta japonica]|uniref:Uncharacterized protein n=1 Tax=Eumeta variegata TaxID=151549 RepID=A0A4C1XM89_EUMVA|nr:hypothetical protein EVAR_41913_1 [Eumeta japonica]